MTFVNQQTTLHDNKLRSGMLFFIDKTELQTNFCDNVRSQSRMDTMRVASCILALDFKYMAFGLRSNHGLPGSLIQPSSLLAGEAYSAVCSAHAVHVRLKETATLLISFLLYLKSPYYCQQSKPRAQLIVWLTRDSMVCFVLSLTSLAVFVGANGHNEPLFGCTAGWQVKTAFSTFSSSMQW